MLISEIRDNSRFDPYGNEGRPRDSDALAEAYCNLAREYLYREEYENAATLFSNVVSLNSDYLGATCALASLLSHLGRPKEAIAHYERALAVRPDADLVRAALGELYISLGDLEHGLPLCEARFESHPGFAEVWTAPPWRGEPLNGDRIVLQAEGGFGDVLQYVRYAPLLAARGGLVELLVPKELQRLLAASWEGVDGIRMPPLPVIPRWQCPMQSLPFAFDTRLETIPNTVPYLKAPAEEVEKWAARIQVPGLKVGLVWAGNPRTLHDVIRSISLEAFAPFSGIDSVSFFSLQAGDAARQIANPPPRLNLQNLHSERTDFLDAACAVLALDLVITVDTAMAHLAGALGKPVWVLLFTPPDSRWLYSGERSPWYPTARLFRQTIPGKWAPVIERVADELRTLAQQATGSAS